MHRGLGEMLIYTIIIVLLRTREATSEESENYENRLSTEVIGYRKLIDPDFAVSAPVSEDAAAEEWIRPEVLQSLAYNMRFVMKLVSDFYQCSLLSYDEDAEVFVEEERKLMVRQTVFEPRNLIESVACSLFPRLLAFLYISTNDPSTYVQLHRLHTAFCVKMPKMKTITVESMGESFHMCDTKTETLLQNIRLEFPHPSVSTKTDWINGASFVTNVHNCVKGVDKKRMLTTVARLKNGRKNVFGVAEGDFVRGRPNEKKKKPGETDKKIAGELEENLRQLNLRYHANESTAEEEKEMSVPDAVNRTMTRAFRTLVARSGRAVRGLSDDDGKGDWIYGRSTVVLKLDDVTGGQCKWMPLVLVYLADNCSDGADTSVLFSLYLTLCGDWTDFLEVHCPNGPDRFDEYACLKDATENRLLVNFHSATGEFPDYDEVDAGDDNRNNDEGHQDYYDMVEDFYDMEEDDDDMEEDGDVEEDDDVVEEEDVEEDDDVEEENDDVEEENDDVEEDAGDEVTNTPLSAFKYVKAVLENVNYYYEALDDNVPVWTDSDWLTGNGLLAYHRQNPRNPTSALRKRTITLPDTEMLLSEAHDLLLPWNSDARNVFAFHAVLFGQADRLLDDFVYRHAEVVGLYLQHVAARSDVTPSNRLNNTIGWYAECARKFSEDLPGPHEPRGERSAVDGVVSAIKNLGDVKEIVKRHQLSDKDAKDLLAVPTEKRTELSAWSARRLSDVEGSEYLKKLNLMLQKICLNAVLYVNNFVTYVRKSKMSSYHDTYILLTYCEQFVKDVFVESSVPTNYLTLVDD